MTSHHDVVARLRATLGGIAQEECCGDNLTILLASYFEPGIESEELDDCGTWKQGAIDACDKVLDAIHAHYTPLLESQAKALSEWKQAASVEAGLRREFYDRALAAEARLAEFKIEATKVIDELVADLSGEIEGRYAGIKHYPSEARRYARDIAPVVAARAFTNAAKTQESKDA